MIPQTGVEKNVELEDVACDLCGSSGRQLVLVSRDVRYGVPGEFQLQRCHDCGLVYVSPRPRADSLQRYYPPRYHPFHAVDSTDLVARGSKLRQFVFGGTGAGRWAMGWLYNSIAYRAFLPTSHPGKVLDVGCGTGGYLRSWKHLGWDIEGIEPSAEAAAIARQSLGAPIHTGIVEDVDVPDDRFDLVTMAHSLEHMRSPRLTLQLARRSLKSGGSLLVMVPNFAAWDRRIFGERWYGMEIPRHLYHFEPATLVRLLESERFDVTLLGGSAHPDGLVRNVRGWFGTRDHEHRPGAVERAIATAVLLPLAVVRRSSAMWVLATRGADAPIVR